VFSTKQGINLSERQINDGLQTFSSAANSNSANIIFLSQRPYYIPGYLYQNDKREQNNKLQISEFSAPSAP
jgi:hypothetical protein